jgi:hypothetical protein
MFRQEGKRHQQKKRHLAAFVFVPLFLGRVFELFRMISAGTSCWEIERKEPNV